MMSKVNVTNVKVTYVKMKNIVVMVNNFRFSLWDIGYPGLKKQKKFITFKVNLFMHQIYFTNFYKKYT